MNIPCDNKKCKHFGEPMDYLDDDSRQEWYEAYYECANCGTAKTHRTEYDQNGLVTSDEILDSTKRRR